MPVDQTSLPPAGTPARLGPVGQLHKISEPPAPKPEPARPQAAPEPLGRPASVPLPSARPDSLGLYTTQPGDTLSKIARERLGNGNRWKELYELNRDKIANPDLIHPGQILQLPARIQPARLKGDKPAPAVPTGPKPQAPHQPAKPPAAKPEPAQPAALKPEAVSPTPTKPKPASPQPAEPKAPASAEKVVKPAPAKPEPAKPKADTLELTPAATPTPAAPPPPPAALFDLPGVRVGGPKPIEGDKGGWSFGGTATIKKFDANLLNVGVHATHWSGNYDYDVRFEKVAEGKVRLTSKDLGSGQTEVLNMAIASQSKNQIVLKTDQGAKASITTDPSGSVTVKFQDKTIKMNA